MLILHRILITSIRQRCKKHRLHIWYRTENSRNSSFCYLKIRKNSSDVIFKTHVNHSISFIQTKVSETRQGKLLLYLQIFALTGMTMHNKLVASRYNTYVPGDPKKVLQLQKRIFQKMKYVWTANKLT